MSQKIFQVHERNVILLSPFDQVKAFKNIVALKQKGLAQKLLAFVYFYSYWDSPYKAYKAEQAEEKLYQELEIPQKYQKSKLLFDAVDYFIEREKSLVTISLENLRSSLQIVSDSVTFVGEHIESSIKKYRERLSPDYMPPTDKEGNIIPQESIDLKEFVSTAKELIKLSNDFKSALDTVRKLEQEARLEQSDSDKIQGGGKVGRYE